MRRWKVRALALALATVGILTGALIVTRTEAQEEDGPARAARSCPLCGTAAETGWTYCPADGVRLPGRSAEARVEGVERVAIEYADGSQRIYRGAQARRLLEVMISTGFRGNVPDTARRLQSPPSWYHGIRYMWIGARGEIGEGANGDERDQTAFRHEIEELMRSLEDAKRGGRSGEPNGGR